MDFTDRRESNQAYGKRPLAGRRVAESDTFSPNATPFPFANLGVIA